MRIGIDARFYGPRHGGGGIGRYVQELLRGLQAVPNQHRFTAFLHPERLSDFPSSPAWQTVSVHSHWYTLREQWEMPRAFLGSGVDLVHVPHFNVPLRMQVPFVATIHDLILYEVPESARATTWGPTVYGVKRLALRATLLHIARAAQHIFVPSQATATRLLEFFPEAAGKILITPEGADHIPQHAAAPAPERPTFLYVGSSYPHKNLHRLLDAFALVQAQQTDAQLHFVGRIDRWMGELAAKAQRFGTAVQFHDFVSEERLADFYRNSTAFVYPSLAEGFGIPPLEAMRYGTAVVASGIPCLREVLGDAAAFADPHSPEALAEAMLSVCNNERRQALQALGAAKAAQYTWTQTAEKTLAGYTLRH